MAASHGLEGSLTLESLRKLWKDELLKDVRNEVKVAVIQLKEEMNLFRKKIDEIEASQKFLASQYDKVLSNLQGTNRSVQDMNANIQHVTQDLIETKEWLDELDSRLDEQQQYGRRDCLEFVGIPKVDNDDPVKLVIETAALAGVEVKEDDISIAHRLKPTKKGQDRIIAKFIRRSKRDEVYSNRKNLKQKLHVRHCKEHATSEMYKHEEGRKQSHDQILQDLGDVRNKAQDVWSKIDDSTAQMLSYHQESADHYTETLQNLKKMNTTISYLLE
ncbi:predicted protein, partial [Nematostella vectensis]